MSVKLASFALLAALPCAVLGTLAVRRVDRESFDVTLGICLCLIGIYLLVKARQSTNRIAQSKPIVLGGQSFWKGLAFCALGGFVSTFLGIGGGIVYVPTLFYVFKAPITTATATSQLIMVGTSLTAILSHINHHSYEGHMALTMILATGCVCGSLLGAKVSGRVRGQTVLSILAVIILLVGIRMIYESSGLHY